MIFKTCAPRVFRAGSTVWVPLGYILLSIAVESSENKYMYTQGVWDIKMWENNLIASEQPFINGSAA